MLPKSKRVNKALFDEVFKKGSVSNGSFFSLRSTRSSDGTHIAFVAPKTVAKTAVKRNALRRKGYNSLPKELPAINGLFFFKKNALSATKENLKNDIKKLLG